MPDINEGVESSVPIHGMDDASMFGTVKPVLPFRGGHEIGRGLDRLKLCDTKMA